jgi:hypothetical protein
MLASGVMLVGVIGALWSLKRAKTLKGSAIGPRHIQFVSVCLIVPTILILGLEKVLTSETTATLIGGLAGYLLSGLGTYEPPRPDTGHNAQSTTKQEGNTAQGGSGATSGSKGRSGVGDVVFGDESEETKATD